MKIKEKHRKLMITNFEYGVKRLFNERSTTSYSVELPGVPDDPQNGILDDTIAIPKYGDAQLQYSVSLD